MPLESAPIIRREDLGFVTSAHERLKQARSQAEAMLAEARLEAERIRQAAASQAATQMGQAYAEGMRSAKRDFVVQMARRGAVDSHALASQTDRLVVVVTRTLEKILAESAHDERFFTGVMSRVLRAARDEKHLTVRVCPDQEQSARRAIDDVLTQRDLAPFIEVVVDPGLGQGSCVVEGAHGVIDASLDVQLDAIRRALMSSETVHAP